MSRIHDALRRGLQPAAPARHDRTAQADAVLAALGYRSERPGAGRGPMLLALAAAIGLAAVLLWAYSPTSALSSSNATAGKPNASVGKPNAPAGKPNASVGRPATAVTTNALPPRTPSAQTPPPIATSVPPNAAPPTFAAAVTPPATRASVAPVPVVKPAPPATTVAPPPAAARAIPRTDAIARQGGKYTASPKSRPVAAVLPPASFAGKPASAAPDDFQLALYYQRTGDFEQALLQYKKVLQADELNVEAHNNLGMLYQGKGLYEDAAREFQRVIAIDPAYLTAHLNLSAAYLKLGRPDAAAAEARAVLAIDPRHSDALVNLALAQEAAGQGGDAQHSLRRALEINPHNAAAHYNLAQQYDKAGEAALAIDHYRQFVQFAGPEQAQYVPDVRARILTLTRGNK